MVFSEFFEDTFRRRYGDQILQEWVDLGGYGKDERRQTYPPDADDIDGRIVWAILYQLTHPWRLFPGLDEITEMVNYHRHEIQASNESILRTPPSKIAFFSGKYDLLYRPWLGDPHADVIFWRS